MEERVLTKHERQVLATLHGASTKHGTHGNINAIRSGVYANRLLGEEERLEFASTCAAYHASGACPVAHVELAALYRVQILRAIRLHNLPAAEALDRRWRGKHRQLQAHLRAQHCTHEPSATERHIAWVTESLARQAAQREASLAPDTTTKETSHDETSS